MRTLSPETRNRHLRTELRTLRRELRESRRELLACRITMQRLSNYMSVFASTLDKAPRLRLTIMKWSAELRTGALLGRP